MKLRNIKKTAFMLKGIKNPCNSIYWMLLFLSFFVSSCTTEKDIAASLDDFNLAYEGPSYPNTSYDDAAYFFNGFIDWLVGLYFGGYFGNDDVAEQTKGFSKMNVLVKLQFIKKGSQNKYANGKTHTNLSYIEVPLYALYQAKLSGGKIFGGIGPYLGYGVIGKIKSTNNGQTSSVDAFTQTGGFKRFDAGLAATAGYKTSQGLGFSLGYELGLANIAVRNAGGDKTKNRGFSFNISYDLDKLLSRVKK